MRKAPSNIQRAADTTFVSSNNMSIYLCCGNIIVAQQLLNTANVCAPF